jgi:hypothetical protein
MKKPLVLAVAVLSFVAGAWLSPFVSASEQQDAALLASIPSPLKQGQRILFEPKASVTCDVIRQNGTWVECDALREFGQRRQLPRLTRHEVNSQAAVRRMPSVTRRTAARNSMLDSSEAGSRGPRYAGFARDTLTVRAGSSWLPCPTGCGGTPRDADVPLPSTPRDGNGSV